MKKFLGLMAFTTLVTTSIPSINIILDTNINHKLDVVDDKIWHKLINKSENDVKRGGINYLNYYGFYYLISLNHKLVNDLNNALGAGIGVIISLLNVAFPEFAWIITSLGAILIAQWYCWEIPDYDNQNGVVLKMIGVVVPSVIIGVNSQ